MRREVPGSSRPVAAGWFRWRPRAWRWLLAGVVAVVAPKCLLCATGYVIVLTGVGWAGPELCGGSVDRVFSSHVEWIAVGFAAAALALMAALVVKAGRRRAQQTQRS